MRIAVLPGIWPPDVGGPATHGPELARFLVERGHSVQVVTMASAPPTELPCPVTTVDRGRPFPLRYGELTARETGAARHADVVYASSTYAAAAGASMAARRPLVVKLVSDPAYERARRWGLFGGTLEEFQHAGGGRLTALKRGRTLALRRARTLIVPSRYLAEIARGWGLDDKRLHVVPNPAPPRAPFARRRSERTCPFRRIAAAGAGARRARRRRSGRPLERLGELPSRSRRGARRGHADGRDPRRRCRRGRQRRGQRTAGAARVAGGIRAGVAAAARFARAADAPFRRRPQLRARAESRSDLRADRGAAGGGGPAVTEATAEAGRPRILMVGRMTYPLPLPGWLTRKFDALERQLDLRVVATADPSSTAADPRFHLLQRSRIGLLDGVLFYLRLPFHVRRQINEFRPEAIIAESPYTAAPALVGRAIARGKPQIVIEVHGDWRTATRLYGSPSRRVLSPLADAVGRTALRRGDAVRALSSYTEGLVEDVRGIPVTASFEAYMDLSTFTAKPPVPLPERPAALFVGMLEAYKNIDGLVAAWRKVVRELPEAKLVLVGKGTRKELVDELVAELPDHVEHIEELLPDGVSEQMDRCTVLVLPSRSEGLGRVLVEAMARGRGIVASRVGGIPDVARDDREALLVTPGDVDELAAALVRVLSDRPHAVRLGEAAFTRYQEWHTTPAEYAARVRSLVDASLREAGALPGERPRVLIVSAAPRAATPEQPDPALDALREEVDYCVLLAMSMRRRDRPSIVVETHRDWRTATRLGGSRFRFLSATIADWAAR